MVTVRVKECKIKERIVVVNTILVMYFHRVTVHETQSTTKTTAVLFL